MSYESHPRIITPSDETVLWRYLDFAKFLQMIESRGLWFARADQFNDPFEGGYTDAELTHLRAQDPPIGQSYIRAAALTRATTFVNCWRAGSDESMAMWDLYGKGSGIVAIKTTIGDLKRALGNFAENVYIGAVKYIDWKEAPWDNNTLAMCVRKILAYRHESEVRAIFWNLSGPSPSETVQWNNPSWEDSFARLRSSKPIGVSVPVDLQFISEVIVGPREQNWVEPLVRQILARYGLQLRITASDLLKSRF